MAHTPRVWHKHDPNCPEDAIYVGRPTQWGNPWSEKPTRIGTVTRVASREEAIAKFVDWIMSGTPHTRQLRRDARAFLRGKNLSCWCAPEDCHAEIWLLIANGPFEDDDEIPF